MFGSHPMQLYKISLYLFIWGKPVVTLHYLLVKYIFFIIQVQDLIYHTELAKGAYKDSPASLARHCMLRESNVLKFVKDSSVLRPGYYIGIDHRQKLVIFGIRGTHTVYDLITDIVSSSDEEITFEGYSTHFGTAEAARWFLTHEIKSIKNCLDEHKVVVLIVPFSSAPPHALISGSLLYLQLNLSFRVLG